MSGPFDPEVVALLREVAADPSAGLLRLPKERLVRWVGRPEELVSTHGSRLTKAERHLVQAYREEVAWVLQQVCIEQLKLKPLIFSTIVPDHEQIKEASKRLLEDNGKAISLEELQLVVDGDGIDLPRLASAALRLVPTDFGRNCLALCLQREGHDEAAFRILEKILAGESNAGQRAQAFENQALLWVKRQSFERAGEANQKATATDESKIRLLVWCFTSAVQSGFDSKAREFAARIESHPAKHDLAGISKRLVTERRAGLWEPTIASRLALRRLRSEVPELMEGILDAFE